MLWSHRFDDSFDRLMRERARKMRLQNELELHELEKENDEREKALAFRKAFAR